VRTGGWYGCPVAAACVVLAAVAGAAALLLGAEYGPRETQARSAFAVTLRHYGVDAREIERSLAIPLEDALASAPGACGVSSSSEYGKARVVVHFSTGTDSGSACESVRDAAERIYQTLPSSVQRPELGSTSEGRGPVWVAAVYSGSHSITELGSLLERTVKPALEKIAGAGEVELAGSGLPEVMVEVDQSAAALLGVDAGEVARFLAMNDALMPAGILRSDGRQIVVVADGRYSGASTLRNALIPSSSGQPVTLGSFCSIIEGHRKPETLSRVNGQPAMTVAVNPGGGANLPALSRAIAYEVESLATAHGIRFEVLSDVGAEVARSFGSTISATFQGALAVAVATALLVGSGSLRSGNRVRFVAMAAVPVVLVVSAALLSALGFGLDRHVLAGLAVGLGVSVDAAILAAERLGNAASVRGGVRAMRELAPSLASGSATTLVVLVPLAGLDFLSEGVARVAAAIAAVCIVSFLYTVLIMPPLMLGGSPGNNDACVQGVSRRKRGRRRLHRLLALNALLCGRKPRIPLVAAVILSIAGFVSVLSMPLETRVVEEENIVYAQLEFEPGSAASSVDLRLADYAEAILARAGLKSIQSTARRGSGSVAVSFDATKTDRDQIAAALRGVPLSSGFVWIPGSSKGERSWELVVSGDDDASCRNLCSLAAQAVSALPFIVETVLNYKDGPPDLILHPDRNRAASLALGFSSLATALRTSIHGPVAYKRLGDDGETDVRVTVQRSGFPESSDALSTLVLSSQGGVQVASFTQAERRADASRINRRDRQRVASLTMRSGPIDPRAVRAAVLAAVSGIELPPGYTFEFDREAIEAASRLRGAGWSFLLAAAFACMVVAAVTESFGAPVAVFSALPPSLAVPALLLAASGAAMDATVACAFVAVSGMVVNASVLTVDERRHQGARSPATVYDLYSLMRARFGALAATSGTTVAGALPFLFLADSGSSMVRSLAFVSAAGTAASFLMALVIIPALASIAPALFHGCVHSECPSRKGSQT